MWGLELVLCRGTRNAAISFVCIRAASSARYGASASVLVVVITIHASQFNGSAAEIVEHVDEIPEVNRLNDDGGVVADERVGEAIAVVVAIGGEHVEVVIVIGIFEACGAIKIVIRATVGFVSIIISEGNCESAGAEVRAVVGSGIRGGGNTAGQNQCSQRRAGSAFTLVRVGAL